MAQVELACRRDELDMQQRRAFVRTFVRRVVAHRPKRTQELHLHIEWALDTDTGEREVVAEPSKVAVWQVKARSKRGYRSWWRV
jgi:hypothetical protein